LEQKKPSVITKIKRSYHNSNPRKPMQRIKFALKRSPLFFSVIVISFIIIAALIFPITKLYSSTKIAFEERAMTFDLYRESQDKLKVKNAEMYLEKIQNSFTDEQLKKIIEKHTTYKLFINNKIAEKKTATFYSTTDKTLITFYEQYPSDVKDMIPEALIKKYSKIDETEILKLIKISANAAKYTITEQEYPDGRKLYIQFDSVKTGEIITLDLESNFAKTLGLEEYSIEIFYNKAT